MFVLDDAGDVDVDVALGTLEDEIICSDVVKAYLNTFCNISGILWARVPVQSTAFQTLTSDGVMPRLCKPGGGVRIYIDCVRTGEAAGRGSSSSSSSVATGAQQTVEIVEFVGNKGHSGRLGLSRSSIHGSSKLLGAVTMSP